MDVFAQPAFSSHDNEHPLEHLHSPVVDKPLNQDLTSTSISHQVNPNDPETNTAQSVSQLPPKADKINENTYGEFISPNDGFFAPEIRIDITGPPDGPTPPPAIQQSAPVPLISYSPASDNQSSSILETNLPSVPGTAAVDKTLEFSDELPIQPKSISTEKKPLVEEQLKPTTSSAEKSTTVVISFSVKLPFCYLIMFLRLMMLPMRLCFMIRIAAITLIADR